MHREQLEAILAIANPAARLACMLAGFAGLRAGEVRGLCWSDVDFTSNTITVRRSITRREETTPKSHHHRVIPMATPLRTVLEGLAPKDKRSQWGAVATTSFGKPWGESGLYQAFERAQQRANLEGWTFHDLRHFFVTELFRRGAPAPAVQLLAGHADLSTTQRYADMAASDLQRAIALFGEPFTSSQGVL
jgi:integrase